MTEQEARGGGLDLGSVLGRVSALEGAVGQIANVVPGAKGVLTGVAQATGEVTQAVGDVTAGVGQALPIPVVQPVVVDAGKTVAGVGGAIQAVTAPTPPIEKGWQTSEGQQSLLVKIILGALGFLTASGIFNLPAAAAAVVMGVVPGAMAVEQAVYTMARTSRKNPPH